MYRILILPVVLLLSSLDLQAGQRSPLDRLELKPSTTGPAYPKDLVALIEPRGERERPGGGLGSWSTTVSPDGKYLACNDADGTVHLRDAELRLVKRLWPAGTSREIFKGLVFTPDGKQLLGCRERGGVQLWNLDEEKTAGQEILSGDKRTCWALAVRPDNQQLAVAVRPLDGKQKNELRLFARWGATFAETTIIKTTASIWRMAYHPTGQLLACGGDNRASVWDLTGVEPKEQILHEHPLNGGDDLAGVAFAPNGKLLANRPATSART